MDSAFANFDSISYAKGNASLRQLATWLGDKDFFAGVNAYLTRHRFGNATLADFVGSLDAVSDRDVRGLGRVWLRTSGSRHAPGHPGRGRAGPGPGRAPAPTGVRLTAYDERAGEVDRRMVDARRGPGPTRRLGRPVVVPNSHG